MFTGIIEETGVIKKFIKSGTNDALISVESQKVLEGTKIGDSISINGVCQTVTELGSDFFSAQVSFETLNVTNFPDLKIKDSVNLERALSFNGRLGGHVVTGHVDGRAKVKKIQKWADFYDVKFEVEKGLEKHLVRKGSICVNGVSLTVADTYEREFTTAIIPHTFENTNLKTLTVGDLVNIETDVLAKYVEKILSTGNNGTKLNESFLKENGFF